MPISLPREPPLDDELTRYLLGALSEEDTERLDELTLVDDEMAARLRLAEDELLDAYASGALSGDRLERFETCYLRTPLRRDKAAFAKRFLAAVDATHARPAGATPYAGARRHAWLAAAAMLVLASGVLLLQGARLRSDLRDAERRVAASEERSHALLARLQQQQQQQQQQRTAATVKPAPAAAPGAALLTTIALVLLPQTRGVDPVPIVGIHGATATVPVDLRVDAAAGASYEAALRDPATNGVVWRSAALTPLHGRRPPVVPVAVPAGLLKAQHYVLDLFARAPGGAPELVGTYAFEVVRP